MMRKQSNNNGANTGKATVALAVTTTRFSRGQKNQGPLTPINQSSKVFSQTLKVCF